MKKILALSIAALCAVTAAGCTTGGDTVDSVSVSSASGQAGDDAEGGKPTIKYVTGDFTYDECLVLPEYKGIEINRISAEITDADVDDYITSLVTPEVSADPEAVCENGDIANIDYDGTVDGEHRDGMTAEGQDLALGSGSFIPGFEDGVVGMKVGEEKDLTLTFPEDYFEESLRGAEAVFHVKVNSIKKYPEITDEWAAEYTKGEYTTAEAYKNSIRERLAVMQDDQAEALMQNDLITKVYEGTEFIALPEEYVNEEMDAFEKSLESYASLAEQSKEEYLESLGMTVGQYQDQKRSFGEENAKMRLIIDAIWEKEGMSVEDDLYKEQIKKISEANGMSEDQLKEAYGEKALEKYCRRYAVVDRLMEYANIKDAE